MLLGAGLIVFRETLEAALFVGIVAAATAHRAGRTRWLCLGVLAGALGSALLAAGMDRIAARADGLGQDLLAVLLLTTALILLAWHTLQAPRLARQARIDADRLGAPDAARAGSMIALTGAVALAVLREGAETVLFVAGTLTGSGTASADWLISVAAGLVLGVFAGWSLARGLGRLSPRRLFAATQALLMLLAGSLASQLARTLHQANWLTVLADPAWDASGWLPNHVPLAIVLHGLIGYDAAPSELQLLAYLVAVGLLATATGLSRPLPRS
ncbi:MAG: FTR1 family protein [Betaproteobacteria bacterium]|nr:FTR1 family protein [Betaproteobacteria bacterium]